MDMDRQSSAPPAPPASSSSLRFRARTLPSQRSSSRQLTVPVQSADAGQHHCPFASLVVVFSHRRHVDPARTPLFSSASLVHASTVTAFASASLPQLDTRTVHCVSHRLALVSHRHLCSPCRPGLAPPAYRHPLMRTPHTPAHNPHAVSHTSPSAAGVPSRAQPHRHAGVLPSTRYPPKAVTGLLWHLMHSPNAGVCND